MEEGVYLIKRTKKLPQRGNGNYLYVIEGEEFEKAYLWQSKGTYEEILNSASGGSGEIFLEEGTNVTITGSGTEEDPYVVNSDGGIGEAPLDGGPYGRQAESWVEIGGGTPTLQEVTEAGNTTTNSILTKGLRVYRDGLPTFTDLVFGVYNNIGSFGAEWGSIILRNNTPAQGTISSKELTGNRSYKLPDNSGTLATQEWVATEYTVATLPVAPTTQRYAIVTDATAPTYLGALTGDGEVTCPVFWNGTIWVSH